MKWIATGPSGSVFINVAHILYWTRTGSGNASGLNCVVNRQYTSATVVQFTATHTVLSNKKQNVWELPEIVAFLPMKVIYMEYLYDVWDVRNTDNPFPIVPGSIKPTVYYDMPFDPTFGPPIVQGTPPPPPAQGAIGVLGGLSGP